MYPGMSPSMHPSMYPTSMYPSNVILVSLESKELAKILVRTNGFHERKKLG